MKIQGTYLLITREPHQQAGDHLALAFSELHNFNFQFVTSYSTHLPPFISQHVHCRFRNFSVIIHRYFFFSSGVLVPLAPFILVPLLSGRETSPDPVDATTISRPPRPSLFETMAWVFSRGGRLFSRWPNKLSPRQINRPS